MRFLRIPGRSRRGLIAFAVALAAALHPIPSPAAPGDPDATFGSGGIALVAADTSSSAEAVVVQGDGKIVAAGYVSGSSVDMAAIRLDSTGALDSSFGTGGVVKLPAGMQSIAYAAVI